MIKLFISDLDGTYLNHLHISTKYAKETVFEVINDGKEFVIATGRHLHKNHQVGINFFNAPIYKIAMNGAIIWDKQHQVIYKKAIDPVFVQTLVNTFPDVSFELITHKGVFVSVSRFSHIRAMLKNKLSIKAIVKYGLALWTKDYFFETDTTRLDDVLMISCRIGKETKAQAVKAFLKEHSEFVMDYGPNVHNFEIVATGVNKQVASSWLAKHLNVDENDVAVYGNDLNDVPMLQHFKHSFAPDNAVELAKIAAKQVVGSCERDGVAKHIRQTLQHNTEMESE
ncbi:HAD family phosphatase [Carnobacteriaceae bacterium zg-ZUI240]|nr:HAD family phosphatase [Carnobacteriaceae bacterium zg-ZUI240]